MVLFLTSQVLLPLFLAPIQSANPYSLIQQMSFAYFPRKEGEKNLRNGEDDFQQIKARNEVIRFGAK
jgi:hypothetical protein